MKLPQLTFTRFVAAISIVIFHFGLLLFPFNDPAISIFTKYLNSLVSYFFVLSGFILVIANYHPEKAIDTIDKKKFYINRFARIYPIYFVALICVIVLLRYEEGIGAIFSWNKTIAHHILMIQAWNPDFVISYNYPGWSLSVEMLFYALFPFLFIALKNFSWKTLLIISISVWIVNNLVLYGLLHTELNEKFIFYFPLLHLPTFLVGIVAGLLFVRYNSFFTQHTVAIHLTTLILLAFVGLGILFHIPLFAYYHNGMFAPLFISFIYSLSLLKGKPLKILSMKGLVYLGEISYSIYILQIPVAICIFEKQYFFSNISYAEKFWLYLFLVVLVSAICYEMIELPLQKKIRARFSKK